MEDFLVHTKTKKEAVFFAELFYKMKDSYERNKNKPLRVKAKKAAIQVSNKETIEAMNELKKGKGIKFDSVKSLFESI